jgi:predicted RNA-binding protein with TRAM domain
MGGSDIMISAILDWKYFNTLLWGVPSVAIAIMTGIIFAAYQKEVVGWARIAALSIGSFLFFALTVESIKKRQHMDVLSRLLMDLQKSGLQLSGHFIFAVGLQYDIERYLANKPKMHKGDDKVFNFFKVFYARRVLTLVVFVSAVVVVAGLADYEFVKLFNNQFPEIMIGIIIPFIIFGMVLYSQIRSNKQIKKEVTKPVYEVEIIDKGKKGDGIARYQDFVIFVKDGEVGQKVKVKVRQVRDRFATGTYARRRSPL